MGGVSRIFFRGFALCACVTYHGGGIGVPIGGGGEYPRGLVSGPGVVHGMGEGGRVYPHVHLKNFRSCICVYGRDLTCRACVIVSPVFVCSCVLVYV